MKGFIFTALLDLGSLRIIAATAGSYRNAKIWRTFPKKRVSWRRRYENSLQHFPLELFQRIFRSDQDLAAHTYIFIWIRTWNSYSSKSYTTPDVLRDCINSTTRTCTLMPGDSGITRPAGTVLSRSQSTTKHLHALHMYRPLLVRVRLIAPVVMYMYSCTKFRG